MGQMNLAYAKEGGLQGGFREPSPELTFRNFIISLSAKVLAFGKLF